MIDLTAISIDDEPRAHKVIEHYAAKIDELNLVRSFTSPIQAATYLATNTVDILLLDINMPDLDGISLLKTLKSPPLVIFTTAYEEYAVESYDYEAVGYLLKPIEFPKFYQAIQRVIDIKLKSRTPMTSNVEQSATINTISLKNGSKTIRLNTSDIHYLEASGNYAEVNLPDQKVFVDHSLNELIEKHLPKDFIRIHRSFIINSAHLSEYESHQLKIGKKHLPIGKTYRSAVKQRLSSLQ